MEARLRYVIPLTLVLVVALLYLSMRGWPQTFLVMSGLPFAVAGSVWLLAFMDYNLSTAVWVGLIAVAGVAAETGIVMMVYLDEAFTRYMREGAFRGRGCRRRRGCGARDVWSCMLLTLLVLPAAYAMWRRYQVRVATAVSPLMHTNPATSPAAA